jgi:ribonucleoside-diphosphate reductase alpha chain
MPEQLLDYKTTKRLKDRLTDKYESNLSLSTNSDNLISELYLRKLETGESETIPQRMAAISVDVASADMKYMDQNIPLEEKVEKVAERAETFMQMYINNEFRANTPTNLNFGRFKPEYNNSGEVVGYKQSSQLGSACFVVPIDDMFASSVETLEDGIDAAWVTQQHIHKGGGGTGFSFERLRPKGAIIGYDPHIKGMNSIDWESRTGISSGPESFLRSFYDAATDATKQGNSRRGANMGIQRIDHMDFLDHLYAKHKGGNESSIRNFNLSMAITDEFMEAALKDETYTLFNPHRAQFKDILGEGCELVRKEDLATRQQFETLLEKDHPNAPVAVPSMYLDDDGRTVIDGYEGKEIGTIVNGIVNIYAKKVLDTIVRRSDTNGEPGVVFIDRMNEYQPLVLTHEIEATNPCGEQPLLPHEACNLGSFNVGKFTEYGVFNTEAEAMGNLEGKVSDPRLFKVKKRKNGTFEAMYVNTTRLGEALKNGVRFLDNVIDRNDFPSKKIRETVDSTRKVGVGYMGVGDAMIMTKIRYGSEESFEFAEALAQLAHDKTREASEELAEERGTFPLWEVSIHNPESEAHKWFMSNPEEIPDKHRGSRKLSSMVNRERVMNYTKPLRNSYITTQAPTGSISRSDGIKLKVDWGVLDNTRSTSGIEGVFSIVEESPILNSMVKNYYYGPMELLRREGVLTEELIEAIEKNKGSVFEYSHTSDEVKKVLNIIPEDVREVLVTTAGGEKGNHEIPWEAHVGIYNRFQKWNDSSISKTMNMPEESLLGDTKNAIIDLWKSAAKGATIYRNNSRKRQILNTTQGEKLEEMVEHYERPLLQDSKTLEMPYVPPNLEKSKGQLVEYDPGSCFTHITYDGATGLITGAFQDVAEVNTEILSLLASRNMFLSRLFKGGRTLDQAITELEKTPVTGSVKGVLKDKGVIPEGEPGGLNYDVSGGTTTESLLGTLYVMKFMTENGTKFDPTSIGEKMDKYRSGKVSLKTIINSKGEVTMEEGNGRKTILGGGTTFKIPEIIDRESNCPECGP